MSLIILFERKMEIYKWKMEIQQLIWLLGPIVYYYFKEHQWKEIRGFEIGYGFDWKLNSKQSCLKQYRKRDKYILKGLFVEGESKTKSGNKQWVCLLKKKKKFIYFFVKMWVEMDTNDKFVCELYFSILNFQCLPKRKII